MRKILIALLSIILISGMAMGQKTNDPAGGGNNDGGGGGGSDTDCLSALSGTAGMFAGQYHSKLLGSSNKKEMARSYEIMPIVGYSVPLDNNNLSYYNFLPRVRVNYGALSGDLLIDYWADTEDFSVNPYKAAHGLAMFNIIPNNMFRAAIGQGVLYNLDTEGVFHESFLGIEGAIMRRTITGSLEGRLAYDYEISKPVYISIEAKGGYKLLAAGPTKLYANAGLAYRDVNNGWQDIVPFIGLNLIIN
jgi:hypothetical protein